MRPWEVQTKLYAQNGRAADKAHEDLIARRILRGIGAKNAQRDIKVLEQRVLGYSDSEQPMLKRAINLFITLLRRIPDKAYLSRKWDIQVAKVKSEQEAIARMTVATSYRPGDEPLLLTRLHNTSLSRTYRILASDALYELIPPYTVLEAELDTSLRLIAQETTMFIKSLGPYPLETFNGA